MIENLKATIGLQKDFNHCYGCSTGGNILNAHTSQPIYLVLTRFDSKGKETALAHYCYICSLDELEKRKRFIIALQNENYKEQYKNFSKVEQER